jgi:hypothetical protein
LTVHVKLGIFFVDIVRRTLRIGRDCLLWWFVVFNKGILILILIFILLIILILILKINIVLVLAFKRKRLKKLSTKCGFIYVMSLIERIRSFTGVQTISFGFLLGLGLELGFLGFLGLGLMLDFFGSLGFDYGYGL